MELVSHSSTSRSPDVRSDMRDKVAVITGASGGIGAALAELLASRGAALVLVARREPELRAVAACCGQRARPIVADVTRRDEVRRVVGETLAGFGHIDVWVNNVGQRLRAQRSPWRSRLAADARLAERGGRGGRDRRRDRIEAPGRVHTLGRARSGRRVLRVVGCGLVDVSQGALPDSAVIVADLAAAHGNGDIRASSSTHGPAVRPASAMWRSTTLAIFG